MKSLDFAAVVVHHRSLFTLQNTIRRLLGEGLEPAKILVVDNSEEPDQADSVKDALPAGVKIIFTNNSGYGAAVNEGVKWHKANTSSTKYLLVSTHEALPELGSLQKLEAALDAHEKTALVGPALVTGSDSNVIWSLGGYFSQRLGLPRHIAHKASRSELMHAKLSTVDWLDGAFLLFRRTVLEDCPLDEDFFLYMEEADHHREINRRGWEIRIEPAAVVWQSSDGTPAFYQTRNIQLFQAKNGTVLQALVSAPFIIASAIVRDTIRCRDRSSWKPLLAGWKAGWLLRRSRRGTRNIVLLNPLGGALSHYTDALTQTLRASGAEVQRHEIIEPSVSGGSRWRWLLDYVRLLAGARRFGLGRRSKTLVVWPVLGFLDLILVRLLCGGPTSIVYHDPKPLVRAAGSGPFVARLVFRLPSLPRVVVHSEAAAHAMTGLGYKSSVVLLTHPMLSPVCSDENNRVGVSMRPVVRVLGQYKRDRDLRALEALAQELKFEFDLEIVGRGWPDLEGWTVDSRFVSEGELDYLIENSDAIVIPYLRFYQSGIAIRALERNTPIVGRAATSLADLYGHESRLLVREDPCTGLVAASDWADAVRYAVSDGRQEAKQAAQTYHARTVSEWSSWHRTCGSMGEGL